MTADQKKNPLQELDIINQEAIEESAQDYMRISMDYEKQLGEATD